MGGGVARGRRTEPPHGYDNSLLLVTDYELNKHYRLFSIDLPKKYLLANIDQCIEKILGAVRKCWLRHVVLCQRTVTTFVIEKGRLGFMLSFAK